MRLSGFSKAISGLLDSLDGKIGAEGELVGTGGGKGGLDDGGVGLDWGDGARLEGALVIEGNLGLEIAIGVIVGILDRGAHLIDDFGVTVLLFLVDHVADTRTVGMVVEDIGSVISFGEKFVTHGGVGGFDGVAFGINEGREKGEAMASFLARNIASARRLNLFRSGDEDGGFALARHPETLLGFEVKRK